MHKSILWPLPPTFLAKAIAATRCFLLKTTIFLFKHQNFPMKKVAVVLEAMLWCRYF
jgi:hypothetical protein